MSDETGTETEAESAESGSSVPAASADATPALPSAEAEHHRASFWEKPAVDRYLSPVVLPLAAVVGVIVYVLNVSRLFLSAPGHVAVVLGTIITVVILLGATLLATSPRLRSGSIALITGGFIALILAAGSVNLGHSQPKGEAAGGELPCSPPAKTTLAFTAGPNNQLAFDPKAANATTGLANIAVTDGSATEHTFVFEDTNTQFAKRTVSGSQPKSTCVAFFPQAGDYVYFCDIPGHRQAGMEGVIHVTGNPVTLAEAQAAAGGGGAGAGETPTSAAP